MNSIGIIAIVVGIILTAFLSRKGLLISFGGMFIGIGSNPAKDMPDGSPAMVILGFILIIVGILIVIDDIKKGKTLSNKLEKKLIEQFQQNDDGYISKQFDLKVASAKEKQNQKYKIDIASLNQFANLFKDLAAGDIRRGIKMQNEEGPQQDVAIAGGIADGLFGGGVGAAVALSTMQKNIESTRKHHEAGRKSVKEGIKNIKKIDKNMKEIDKIAKTFNKENNFEYTDVMPDLLNSLEFESISIISDETQMMYNVDLFGNVNDYVLNKLKAYNSLGFFEANYQIKNNFHTMFPNEKNREIDGSFKISLYDGEKEIAYSYIFGDTWTINNLKNAGFKKRIEGRTTFKLIDKNIKIIPSKNYTAKFSEPNLWLVNPK